MLNAKLSNTVVYCASLVLGIVVASGKAKVEVIRKDTESKSDRLVVQLVRGTIHAIMPLFRKRPMHPTTS